jgi:hypothetical protein
MSLNSLQDDMSRRAASMAAMAKRATRPDEIQAIQKSLITGVQSGAIQPYVGIPLIQELTKKLTEAKAHMAQNIAGAGMPQPPAGGPPIAQQVMQQAAQADQSQGVEALPSNLPQQYAGGGIIAFEGGGQVERYANEGYTGTSPAGRFFSGLRENFNESNEAAKLRNKLQMQYGPASALPGLFMTQTDAERQAAKAVAAALPNMSFAQLQQLDAQGPSALPPPTPVTPAVAPTATPAAAPAPAPAAPPPAAPAAPTIPGIGGIKLPTLPTMKDTPAPVLRDLNEITKDMDTKTQAATEKAVTETQNKLESYDEPIFGERKERLGKREAGLEKDTAMGRALNLMSLGFGIAGSKERSVAGALGNEGRQGIADLIRGEAANRAAKDKLEDYRDNLSQQEAAAKKGNYQAATQAGKDAANDLRQATQMTLTGAHYGNTEALQGLGATRAQSNHLNVSGPRSLRKHCRNCLQHRVWANKHCKIRSLQALCDRRPRHIGQAFNLHC